MNRSTYIRLHLLVLALPVLMGGCRIIDEPPVPQEGFIFFEDFWGPYLLQGNTVTGIALSPGDTLFVTLGVSGASLMDGSGSSLVMSPDLGASWNEIPKVLAGSASTSNLKILSAESNNRLIGLDTNEHTLLLSENRGLSWKTVVKQGHVQSVLRLGPDTYLVGFQRHTSASSSAMIFTDAFSRSTPSNLGTSLSISSFHRLRFGSLMAVTEEGGVFVSNDEGLTFTPSTNGLGNARASEVSVSPVSDRVFLSSSQGLFLSNDSGISWHRTRFDVSSFIPGKILALDSRRLLVLAYDASTLGNPGTDTSRYAALWYSLDAGDTWEKIDPLPAERIFDLQVSHSGHFLAATNDGLVKSLMLADEFGRPVSADL